MEESQQLNIGDSVVVESKSSASATGQTLLQGVVAFLGKVSFSTSDDWVGIRLTGPSVGQGKNDGSVQGIQYFGDCGPNDGVFVKKSAVKKRTLSKLEQLRMKREMSASSSSIGSNSKGTLSSISSPPPSASKLRKDNRESIVNDNNQDINDDSSVASAKTTASTMSRLDQIRMKREQFSSSISSANKSNTPIISRSSRSNLVDNDDSSVASGRSTATARSNRSRLDELRQRRLAIQSSSSPKLNNNTSKVDTPSSPHKPMSPPKTPQTSHRTNPIRSSSITTTPTNLSSSPSKKSNLELSTSHLQEKIKILEDKIVILETENSTMRAKAERQPSGSNIDMISYEENHDASQQEHDNLNDDLISYENDITSLQQSLDEAKRNLHTSTQDLHKAEQEVQELKQKLLQAEEKSELYNNAEREVQELKQKLLKAEEKNQLNINAEREVQDLKQKLLEAEEEKNQLKNNISNVNPNTIVSDNEQIITKDEYEELYKSSQLLQTLQKEKLQQDEIQIQLQTQLSQTRDEIQILQSNHSKTIQDYQIQIQTLQSTLTSQKTTIQQYQEKSNVREEQNASHYKERAKVQAELSALQRRVKELEDEKTEHDATIENLVLDKEEIQEKLEIAEDKIEELKIDIESGQIDLDELQMELEDMKERAEKAEAAIAIQMAGGNVNTVAAGISSKEENGVSTDNSDVARALSVQNTRLREALVTLREQSSSQQMELARKLRDAEKEVEVTESLRVKVNTLEGKERKMKSEIDTLKEMVDQGAAYEKMVEDMSERLISLEDKNIRLKRMISELEEGQELNAELEEAQADEIRDLMNDVQTRDTIIVNLEEAIKSQRRREIEYERSMENYKAAIIKLKEEKESLLALHEGSEDMKSHVIAASQKAMAQAAQLAAEASKARKREAEAVYYYIDAQCNGHLSTRFESYLPQTFASSELTSTKGEILASKVSKKASLCLSTILDNFDSMVHKGKETIESLLGVSDAVSNDQIIISESLSLKLQNVIHDVRLSQIAIDVSSECVKLLALGQWPGLLNQNASVELGTSLFNSLPQLDAAITNQLMVLKSDLGFSPQTSKVNITNLEETITNTKLSINSIFDSEENASLLIHWNPPCWNAMKDISVAKFLCFGSSALFSSFVLPLDESSNDVSNNFPHPALSSALMTMEKICSETLEMCEQISNINLLNNSKLTDFEEMAVGFKNNAIRLFSSLEKYCSSQALEVAVFAELNPIFNDTIKSISSLMLLLRASDMSVDSDYEVHPFSPETLDPWGMIVCIIKQLHQTNGNVHEMNYSLRASSLEQRFNLALENEEKLKNANEEISTLNLALSKRCKEISIQNSRLVELEAILSNTSNQTYSPHASPAKSKNDESSHLMEENRILNEAIDVLQRQVDEYEKEIRTIKSPSLKRGVSQKFTPRKSISFEPDLSASKVGFNTPNLPIISDSVVLSLEAALYRPALLAARADASFIKSKAIENDLKSLPPLSRRTSNTEEYRSDISTIRSQLRLAKAEVRLSKASITTIDLSKKDIKQTSDTSQLTESSLSRLEETVKSSKRFLSKYSFVLQ